MRVQLDEMTNMRNIETERLLLRQLTLEDAPDVFEWAGDLVVNKYMPYPLHESVRQSEECNNKMWISI